LTKRNALSNGVSAAWLALVALLATLGFGLGLGGLGCGPRTEGLDATKVPEDIRADYDLFTRRCSKCHSLARPLQSGITDDAQWALYVTRMRRQPGSGISPDDQEHILRFLRWFAADQRRAKAERNGTAPAAPAPASPPGPGGAAPAPGAEPSGGTPSGGPLQGSDAGSGGGAGGSGGAGGGS